MAAQGAILQNHNNELVTCIEELREKREALQVQIRDEELEKSKIQQDLQVLTKRLSHINDSLQRKVSAREEYDKVIQETEFAYVKILESSQTLLSVLRKESANIAKRRQLPGTHGDAGLAR